MAEFCSRMRVCPPQMIPGLCFAILLSVTCSSQLGLEEVFFGPRNQTVKEGSLPSSSVSPQLRSTSVPPVQPLVTQVHSPMLPPPPYPNLPMELPQHPEPQTDARPTTRASTRPPHTTVTKSSPVRLENSLQRPSNQARTPTAEPAEVRGLVDSGGQNGSRQDQSVASSRIPYGVCRAFEDDECLVVTEHNTNTSDTGARPPGLSLVTVQTEPTCEDPRSVTVETYPEPVVDTKIDYSEEEDMKDEEKGRGPPSTPNTPSLQLTEEEWPSITADNRSLCQDTLPPPSSFPSPSPSRPDTDLRSSLTLRGTESLAAPVHHSLSVSHGGAPLMISHHVSVGHATVAVDVHFYPVAAAATGTSVATSTLDNKQENDKARLHQSK